MLFDNLSNVIGLIALVFTFAVFWHAVSTRVQRRDREIERLRATITRISPSPQDLDFQVMRRDVMPGYDKVAPYPTSVLLLAADTGPHELRAWYSKYPTVLENIAPRSVRCRAGLPFRVSDLQAYDYFFEREAVVSAIFNDPLPGSFACDPRVAGLIHACYLYEYQLIYVHHELEGGALDLNEVKLHAPTGKGGVPDVPLDYPCSYWMADMKTIGGVYMNVIEKYGVPCSQDEFLVQVLNANMPLSTAYSELDIATLLAVWSAMTRTAVPMAYLPNDLFHIEDLVTRVNEYLNDRAQPKQFDENKTEENETCQAC